MSLKKHIEEDNVEDIDDTEEIDVDDDGSVYDEEEGDDKQQEKEDEEEDDDDEEEEDDDEKDETIVPKKRLHVYHQVSDSTEIKICAPEKRITSEYMTIYEYAMVVGTRATHITEGSVLYTDPCGLYDARDIAKKEIKENRCPLSISRKISQSVIEIWEVNEMIKPM